MKSNQYHNNDDVILTVCIPTYNREDKVSSLVAKFLQSTKNIEVRVHVDGSSDKTYPTLTKINDQRLVVTLSKNKGRANALYEMVKDSRGKYTMIFDDDDDIYINKLDAAIEELYYCDEKGIVGVIYNMEGNDKRIIGDKFPCKVSNFLRLRSDYCVKGDKKEIVLSNELKNAITKTDSRYRRVPTALYWARIALRGDVLCNNIALGEKNYLKDGLSSKMMSVKFKNAYPMYMLYKLYIENYKFNRYKSRAFLFKSILGVVLYRCVAFLNYAVGR